MEILLLIYITTVIANFMAAMEKLNLMNVKFKDVSYIKLSLVFLVPVVNFVTMYILLEDIKYLRSTEETRAVK